jgi:NADPH:quinone reductase-like Zn-dependent oxidoreductase
MKSVVSVPQTAQAVRVVEETTIDALSFDTVPVPEPSPNQVVVAIKAVSLNYRDLLVVTGRYGSSLQKPLVIASDGAGEVIAVGEAVTEFKPGDRVAGTFFQGWIDGHFEYSYTKSALGGAINGALTTYKVFEQEGLIHLPEHLTYEEGATLPCAAVTAWHAMVPAANVKSGDTVLLLGTGGVSIFGLQFAKMHGARAIITSSSDEKLARAKKLGADEVINYKTTPDWAKEVKRLTDGKGADLVLEVGGAGTFQQSLRAVRFGGQVSLIGVLTGVNESLNIGAILHGNIRVQGIYVGSVAMFKSMNRAIAVNRLKPVIDKVFSLAQTKEAIRHLESAQHFGKLVISVSK